MKAFKSRIVAILLTFAMVFSMIAIPVNADEIITKYDAAAFLKDKGLLQGDDNGDLMLDKQLTREQMMVIMSRLLNQESVAKAYSTDYMTFQDVDLKSDYAHYIAWAQDNGITQGYSQDNFGFGKPLTAWQTKAFFVRALGYKDAADSDIDSKADTLGITKGSTLDDKTPILRVDMAQLMYNTINANTQDGKVLADVIGVTLPGKVVPLEITAAATGASTVTVTFNRAVNDTSKITFVLTGLSTINTTVSWDSTKTIATLTAPSTLAAGAYTVKASGDTFASGKDTASFNIVQNGASKIVFLANNLVKDPNYDSNLKASFTYKILDSYGADITKTFSESDLIVVASKTLNSTNPFDINTDTNTMTLNFADKFTTSDTVVSVTIIVKNSVITGNAMLTISDSAKVSTITLKGIDYPQTTSPTTKILVGKSPAAYILMNAQDQYGNPVNSKASIDSDVLFVKSDTMLNLNSEEYIDSSGNKQVRLDVDTTGIAVGETATVTAVSRSSGKTSTITLNIQNTARADKVTLGDPQNLAAAYDPAGTFALPMTVYDQYGVQLSPDEVVANIDNGNLIITSDSGFAVQIGRTGTIKGMITNANANSIVGTHIITVTTKSGNVATKTITVKDQAYETSIKLAGIPAINLLMGASTKFNYIFYDQYSRQITNPSSSTNVSLEVSDANIIKATLGAQTTGVGSTIIQTTANQLTPDNAVKIETVSNAGSATLTAKLYRSGSIISTVQTTFTVVAGVPSTLSFQIADIPMLASRSYTGSVDGTDKYARPIVLTAKDTSGTIYAIPSNRIMGVTTTDTNLLVISSGPAASNTIKDQDGNYVIAARDRATAFSATDPATKTATVKVLVATDSGVSEVTKTVTISKDDPKTVKVVFADKDLKPGYPYSLDPAANQVTALLGTAAEVGAAPLYVFEVDQYGVYNKVAVPTFKIVNIDRFTGTLNYDQTDSTLNFAASQIKANQPVYVMYLSSSGAYNTFSIQVSNGTM